MIDIILIMREDEANHFTNLFQSLRPNLYIVAAHNRQELIDYFPHITVNTRIITFSTFIIVPEFILEACQYNAYNMHPGPANYPGYDPIGMTRYQKSTIYGVVLHQTVSKVDSGMIIDEILFPIEPDATRIEIALEAYKFGGQIVAKHAPSLVLTTIALKGNGLSWNEANRSSRDFVRQMQRPNILLSDDERKKRFNAFSDCNADAGLELNNYNRNV